MEQFQESQQNEIEENKLYIQKNVHPILEKMLIDILFNKPSQQEICNFMINWLQENLGNFIIQFHYTLNKDQFTQADNISDAQTTEEDQNQSEQEDFVQEIPEKLKIVSKQRPSVCSEVFGMYNKKQDFVPKIIPKSLEQKEIIKKRLSEAFMFQELTEAEINIVVNAMEEKQFKQNEMVINQGEEGDYLYIVDEGELDCFKKFDKDEEPKYLKTYQSGESFGELALLYNAPRAASIKAKTDSVCLVLERETFNHIVKQAAMQKRERYEKFLLKVELLNGMDFYERMQLCDSLIQQKFQKGDYVVRQVILIINISSILWQGEPGDSFFFIEEGTLIAVKENKFGEQNEKNEVYNYKSGDYFGELALLYNQPRAASVICTSDVILLTLKKESFNRLLGSMESILKRNQQKYIK